MKYYEIEWCKYKIINEKTSEGNFKPVHEFQLMALNTYNVSYNAQE